MSTRHYAGIGITVHWDAELCEHAAECVRGAPATFDTERRPWIDATADTAELIAAVVDRCPSRALTYTRTDGAAHGSNGVADPTASAADAPRSDPPTTAPAPTATIVPRRDGPLVVTGALTLDDGTTVSSADRLFLCRCGASGDKPRCDGSHKRIGFEAPGAVVPRKP